MKNKSKKATIENADHFYHNIKFLNKDNEVIFNGSHKKARYYIERNLGEWISKNPPVIRLNFETGGPGQKGNDFELSEKYNRCVVNGDYTNLHKLHIVPTFIKRAYYDSNKDIPRSSHDVVMISNRYAHLEDKFNAEITRFFSIENTRPISKDERRVNDLVRAIKLIETHGVPEARKNVAKKLFKDFFHKDYPNGYPVNQMRYLTEETAILKRLHALKIAETNKKHILNSCDTLNDAAFECRCMFIDIFNPRFLPACWNTDTKAY